MGSRRAGFTEEELLAAGLVQRSKSRPGSVYDRFRARSHVPRGRRRGRVRGFGARRMTEKSTPGQPAKYVNTADGELYHKREVLFGIDLARAHAAKAGRMLLVEGYTDVLALHQAGNPQFRGDHGHLADRGADRRAAAGGQRAGAVPGRRPRRAGRDAARRPSGRREGPGAAGGGPARGLGPRRPGRLRGGGGAARPGRCLGAVRLLQRRPDPRAGRHPQRRGPRRGSGRAAPGARRAGRQRAARRVDAPHRRAPGAVRQPAGVAAD